MSEPFLQIRGIRKEYGPVVAVHDVNLDVRRGEFLTFLGPSGSGKSTTLYILAGFENPTKGDITLEGKTLLATPSHKRHIGMVFQRYTLFPHLTVGENIAFPLKVRRKSKAEIDSKVKEMLRLVRLEGFEDRKPAQMSGGQQQRVALARALAYDPPVLLMDEPLSALDKKLREEIQHEIRRIHQQTEVTILYVTHDQEEALRLSDRIAVFSKGVIDQIGTGPELYANPKTRFVAEFIGDSDFISCDLVSSSGGQATIALGGGAIFNQIPVHGKGTSGARAALMLRPERIRLSRARAAGAGLAATVSDITFLGNNIHVSTETATGEALSVRLPFGHEAIAGLNRGDIVHLDFDPGAAHVFC
ncbi:MULTISPECIES: ABC transporter ATP-binding protein [Rhizobium]|uniref:ABC transporter ATP-binding protein n=1 Tax=Rhizobium phaseoli TaxID=396 RepID=A0A192THN5_9HYPH|nr:MULTISPECIES: ABC transporter ATP-binding protein [Rhizobium]ANL42769.1 spermidine/putrescine ABC transporter ATP-binding protein PotA 3 [Rhizobium phaseoli]ANL55446.1 spermidine/putrescine ABC transporter ATP-binding protein PotA 3 [Rhizobium phaseoli]ANL61755.1 spermidine/putrescine ABC transporter ATP-binding protein PotA 3 [Rhizobium phaseoli]ANL87172.1 spermidine/putrescine ABC transporter ATP-binding protein PotA 3 [Rhizobium phaseoli]ANL93681.1 spermidine/putrescine ABC transporter A